MAGRRTGARMNTNPEPPALLPRTPKRAIPVVSGRLTRSRAKDPTAAELVEPVGTPFTSSKKPRGRKPLLNKEAKLKPFFSFERENVEEKSDTKVEDKADIERASEKIDTVVEIKKAASEEDSIDEDQKVQEENSDQSKEDEADSTTLEENTPARQAEPIIETEKVKTNEPETVTETEKVTTNEPETVTETEKVTTNEPETVTETEKITSNEPETVTETEKVTTNEPETVTETEKVTTNEPETVTETEKVTTNEPETVTETEKVTTNEPETVTETEKVTTNELEPLKETEKVTANKAEQVAVLETSPTDPTSSSVGDGDDKEILNEAIERSLSDIQETEEQKVPINVEEKIEVKEVLQEENIEAGEKLDINNALADDISETRSNKIELAEEPEKVSHNEIKESNDDDDTQIINDVELNKQNKAEEIISNQSPKEDTEISSAQQLTLTENTATDLGGKVIEQPESFTKNSSNDLDEEKIDDLAIKTSPQEDNFDLRLESENSSEDEDTKEDMIIKSPKASPLPPSHETEFFGESPNSTYEEKCNSDNQDCLSSPELFKDTKDPNDECLDTHEKLMKDMNNTLTDDSFKAEAEKEDYVNEHENPVEDPHLDENSVAKDNQEEPEHKETENTANKLLLVEKHAESVITTKVEKENLPVLSEVVLNQEKTCTILNSMENSTDPIQLEDPQRVLRSKRKLEDPTESEPSLNKHAKKDLKRKSDEALESKKNPKAIKLADDLQQFQHTTDPIESNVLYISNVKKNTDPLKFKAFSSKILHVVKHQINSSKNELDRYFVIFNNIEEAVKGRELLSQKKLGKQNLRVRFAQRCKNGYLLSHHGANCLYVSNLPSNFTEEQAKLLSPDIKNCQKLKISKENKCSFFFTFANYKSALKNMKELSQKKFESVKLKVEFRRVYVEMPKELTPSKVLVVEGIQGSATLYDIKSAFPFSTEALFTSFNNTAMVVILSFPTVSYAKEALERSTNLEIKGCKVKVEYDSIYKNKTILYDNWLVRRALQES